MMRSLVQPAAENALPSGFSLHSSDLRVVVSSPKCRQRVDPAALVDDSIARSPFETAERTLSTFLEQNPNTDCSVAVFEGGVLRAAGITGPADSQVHVIGLRDRWKLNSDRMEWLSEESPFLSALFTETGRFEQLSEEYLRDQLSRSGNNQLVVSFVSYVLTTCNPNLAKLCLDSLSSDRILDHIHQGGGGRFVYCGNAGSAEVKVSRLMALAELHDDDRERSPIDLFTPAQGKLYVHRTNPRFHDLELQVSTVYFVDADGRPQHIFGRRWDSTEPLELVPLYLDETPREYLDHNLVPHHHFEVDSATLEALLFDSVQETFPFNRDDRHLVVNSDLGEILQGIERNDVIDIEDRRLVQVAFAKGVILPLEKAATVIRHGCTAAFQRFSGGWPDGRIGAYERYVEATSPDELADSTSLPELRGRPLASGIIAVGSHGTSVDALDPGRFQSFLLEQGLVFRAKRDGLLYPTILGDRCLKFLNTLV